MITISVITPSAGDRPDLLERAKASVAGQLREGDEHLIQFDANDPWGMRGRNRMMQEAKGDLLMFLDDDDIFLPKALSLAGAYHNVSPHAFLVFQMEDYTERVVGGRGTPCFVVPREAGPLGHWREDYYEGDQVFMQTTCRERNQTPHLIDIPIARIKPL